MGIHQKLETLLNELVIVSEGQGDLLNRLDTILTPSLPVAKGIGETCPSSPSAQCILEDQIDRAIENARALINRNSDILNRIAL